MVTVSSTIALYDDVLNELTRAQYMSLAETADALLTEVRDDQVMPFMTGNLQNASTFVDDSNRESGSVSIVSSTPYARRLYYHPEYNFNRAHNPRAGGKWFKDYEDGSKAAEIYAELFRRNGGLG